MIKVFRGTDADFTTNGEVILKPISAVITKTTEEEYIEVEAPLKYADFLIQDNILIVDTLTGKKGFSIFNPVISNIISVKAWLCYQENPSSPADRGIVIAHGKNLRDCEIEENWDDVVTKLIPVGYKGVMLPEGFISIPTPYQKEYIKTIEFDLPEELEEDVETLEDEVSACQSIVDTIDKSIVTLNAKITASENTIVNLQNEKDTLLQRLRDLGDTEPELKEKAVIEAQIPLIDDEIASISDDIVTARETMEQLHDNLTAAREELDVKQNEYDNLILDDLRNQATEYLNVNKYPHINYNLEAHIEGVIEVGDIIKVKHPEMRVDLLTNVIAYEWDCITKKFTRVEFGTQKPTLKGKLTEIEDKIDKTNDTVKKVGNTVTKYKSEYKRDNEEMVSKFISELYGANNGIYGLIQKNQSIIRQTASEISGTVTRVNADLSTQIASLVIRADQIQATVSSNYTDLSGKITSNESKITQTASEIRSEVNTKFTNYSTTTQMNSAISQTATAIRSEVSTAVNGVNQSISTVEQTANKISWLVKSGTSASNFELTDRVTTLITSALNIDAYVTFTNLSQVNTSTVINGGNIKTGTLDCSKITVTNLSANSITSGTLDCSKITVSKLSASSITTGTLDCSKVTVDNLSAGSITTGTLDCSKISVSNLSADSITTGKLDVSRIYAGTYRVMSYNGSELIIGSTTAYYSQTVTIGAEDFKVNGDDLTLSSNYMIIGKSSSRLGFFGSSGYTRQSIARLSTSATLTDVINKVNNLLAILNNHNFISSPA